MWYMFATSQVGPAAVSEYLGHADNVTMLRDLGVLPWWTPEDFSVRFLRPLSSLTHAADFWLWPRAAWLMHAQNLAWYLAVVALAAILYRRLLRTPWVAGLAIVLLAIDDAGGAAASWIASRNVLISTFFGLLSVIAHDRWRRDGYKPGAVLAPLLLAVGLLGAEAAACAGGYLLAHALCFERGKLGKRLTVIVPYAVVGLVWQLYYRAAGYGAVGSGFYRNVADDPVGFGLAALQNSLILGLTQHALPSVSPLAMVPGDPYPVAALAAGVVLVLGAWLIAPLLRARATARFFGLGMLLSALPVGATLPTERLLLMVSVGGFGLVACFFQALSEGRLAGRATKALAGFCLFLHVVLAPIGKPLQGLGMAMIDRAAQRVVAATPREPDVAQRTLVVVDVPLDIVMIYPGGILAEQGRPAPGRARTLFAGQARAELERVDERCLVLRPEGGWLASPLDRFTWDPNRPFRAGQAIRLEGLDVEILQVTKDGRPLEARFCFATPLQDPALLWRRWQDAWVVPFTVPPIGERVELEPRLLL